MRKDSLVKAWNIVAQKRITLEQLFEEILQETIEEDRAKRLSAKGKIIKVPASRFREIAGEL